MSVSAAFSLIVKFGLPNFFQKTAPGNATFTSEQAVHERFGSVPWSIRY
jgi:hypothetical protein